MLNINKRLTNISSSKKVFDAAIAPYQKALQESGYDHKLTYHPEAKQTTRNKRKRKRNVTWYNPPWNSNLKTNLGRKFLCIVDKCFPKIHPLHKIFNRHTLKLSYSCMPNMKSTIASHNKNILSNVTPASTQESRDGCNCRNKNECPLEGQCLQTNVVYQATVTSETSTESYVGLATNFRTLLKLYLRGEHACHRRGRTCSVSGDLFSRASFPSSTEINNGDLVRNTTFSLNKEVFMTNKGKKHKRGDRGSTEDEISIAKKQNMAAREANLDDSIKDESPTASTEEK